MPLKSTITNMLVAGNGQKVTLNKSSEPLAQGAGPKLNSDNSSYLFGLVTSRGITEYNVFGFTFTSEQLLMSVVIYVLIKRFI